MNSSRRFGQFLPASALLMGIAGGVLLTSKRAAAPDRRLHIYLNDHLAGSTAGRELCRRILRHNQKNALTSFLQELLREIEEDRSALLDVMHSIGARRNPAKPMLAWIVTKLGAAKLNGELTRYSPLSRVVELEQLEIGVTGKLSLWRTLADCRPSDLRLRRFDFQRLCARAQRQVEALEKLKLESVQRAFQPTATR